MKRRAFFQSIAKAVGIVALAPQLAFRTKPIEIGLTAPEKAFTLDIGDIGPFWYENCRWASTYSPEYVEWLNKTHEAVIHPVNVSVKIVCPSRSSSVKEALAGESYPGLRR